MKNMSVAALIVSLVVGTQSFAASKQMFCKTDLKDLKTCKNVPENRREELGKLVSGGNPVAITNEKGNLTVHYTTAAGSLQACQVTNDVKQFKMSANPGDRSTAYFIREGHMFDVKMSGEVAKGQCPKASKQDYSKSLNVENETIVELKVIPNGNSKLAAIGRTQEGTVLLSYDTTIKKEYLGARAESYVDSLIEQNK